MSTGMSLGSATFTVKADGVEDLAARFAQMKQGLAGLKTAQEQASKTAEQAAKIWTKVAKEEMEVAKATQASSSQFKGIGMTMMQVGYIADDLQYGFRAIVNNIQPLGQMAAQAFGMSTTAAMAFGGVISIVAVGVNQLINHWGDLTDRLNAAWSGSTVEQLKTIRERAEEAAKAFDELSKKPTEMAEKGSKQLEKAMVEGGLGKWLEAVTVKVSQSEPLKATEEGAVKENFFRATASAREREKLMNEMNRRTARNLLMDADKPGVPGEHARQTLTGMGLSPEMMRAVNAADPKEQARMKRNERLMKMNEEQMKIEQDAAKEAASDKKKKDQHKIDFEREQAAFLKQQKGEQDQLIRQDHANKKHIRGVLGQARDIGEDWRQFERRNQRAEFMGFGDFWKSTQQNILNGGTNDVQKRQLDVQEKIFDLINNNPMMKQAILAAVAGNPP